LSLKIEIAQKSIFLENEQLQVYTSSSLKKNYKSLTDGLNPFSDSLLFKGFDFCGVLP
jgi:hypothetical protein